MAAMNRGPRPDNHVIVLFGTPSAWAASRSASLPSRWPAIAFVYWFLPETKGLPVEDIVRLFERHHETATPITYRPTVEG
jgi:hypothetical protein